MLVNQPIVLILLSTYWMHIMYKVYVSTVYVLPHLILMITLGNHFIQQIVGLKKKINEHVLMIKLYSHS